MINLKMMVKVALNTLAIVDLHMVRMFEDHP